MGFRCENVCFTTVSVRYLNGWVKKFRLQSTVLNQYIIIRKVVTRDPVTESLLLLNKLC